MIGGLVSGGTTPGGRRKRRSSLSDLTSHPEYRPLRPSPPAKSLAVVEPEDPVRRGPSPVARAPSVLSNHSNHSDRPLTPRTSVLSGEAAAGRPNSPRRSPLQPAPLQARKSFGAATAVRPRIAERTDSNLQRELEMIGLELNRPVSTSRVQPLEPNRIRELGARLAAVEARCGDVDKAKAALARKEKELEGVDKLLTDCVAENDVMFERFNEELVKMANGFRIGKAESELIDKLREVRAELGSIKAENM